MPNPDWCVPPIPTNTGPWDPGFAVDSRWSHTRSATKTAAVIPPHFLDAENAFLNRKEDPLHSSWASSSEPPPQMHNTNATTDLSARNGTSATLDQHDACSDHDDTRRTWPATSPSVHLSHYLRPPFVPLELAYATYDVSLTYIIVFSGIHRRLFHNGRHHRL